jgi:hypothetical protein
MSATLNDHIGGALSGFGGVLRCETCRRIEPLGDPGQRVTSTGWPKCCGYTMRWWTQRQINAGEMSAPSTERES